MKIYENGIIRDMTPEELAENRERELMENSRPLTEYEVNRMFIMQNINTVITDDATASRAVEFHPELRQDKVQTASTPLVRGGTRIRWGNGLKKATVDLWDVEANNPDNAPTLWEDITYRDGFRVIPEIITATLAFSEGECGWWADELYRSKVNGNVYSPAVYPNNWEKL